MCLFLFAACESEKQPPVQRDILFRADGTLDFLRPDGSVLRTINVEIASSDSAWARGLMDRRSLTLEQGMLFLFPQAEQKSFWMKNTLIPLDIMFVGLDSQIVNIAKRTPPLSETQIHSTGLAQYVVEVRGGFSDRFDIEDSTRIRWQRSQ
jgi:uncharacterized membrane protein (UPF0127 family)